jgi:hypothetical protein
MKVGGDRIRRLRAVGAAHDAIALRFTLERVLRTADLRPPGVSHHAIVCIRRLRLPMPPPRADAWTARLGREMQQLLTHGVRPFREAVPANAMVIVFADEAELLACLARDWCRGDVDAWWWHSLFGRSAGEELVRRAFAAAVAAVPAAMGLLAEARVAADVVRLMSPIDCEQLAAAVATTFAVPAWTDVLPKLPPAVSTQPPLVVAGPTTERVARLDAALAAQKLAGVASLTAPQRVLLSLTLLLDRDPALARTPGIGPLLRERARSARPDRRDPELAMTTITEPTAGHAPPTAARGDSPVSNRRSDAGDNHDAANDPVRDTPSASEKTAVDENLVERIPDSAAVAIAAAFPTDRGQTASIASRPPEAAAPHHVEGIDTEFAGIVYLVNLALHLELYSDFTQPARPGLDLPLGDFLALVGERVCGTLRDDAVWGVLARLAGREPEDPPGRDFQAPDGATVDRWLDRLVALLGTRTAAALGVDENAALPFLCARAGRIALSPTRLDAFFPLDAHPLAIRVAGLDRDPGWVPAAGRVIAFHYE